ncbi:MAG: YeeE/YedE thiosulfate transporter family protein [Pseudomonas oryzihabitans]|uniref:YeeE/YedE family protein n=1 Tax=Pseudomonas oryzihabitans TaxID=47885 RepID=UPI0029081E0A|nr:YeeE/YedE thiosulfate transporter family protein [Pseudomonas oryzihabitans]MDU4055382.1 YeeE/YedE thiosulfate transporter family protein [Pseudomonas oryzihabitans]
MTLAAYLPALAGGLLLGAAVSLLLLVNGRIAGISGIFGWLLGGQQVGTGLVFVLGLVLGPLLVRGLHDLPQPTVNATWPTVLLAGLLVGFGTRLGSGCTSGHGILGVARGSRRSLAATAVFLAVGLATASLTELLR